MLLTFGILHWQGTRFKLEKNAFDRQFSQNYFCRLLQLRPAVLAQVESQWPGVQGTSMGATCKHGRVQKTLMPKRKNLHLVTHLSCMCLATNYQRALYAFTSLSKSTVHCFPDCSVLVSCHFTLDSTMLIHQVDCYLKRPVSNYAPSFLCLPFFTKSVSTV